MSGDLWAGAEIMTYILLRELAKYPGVSLHAVVLNPGILANKLRESTIEVQLINERKLPFASILCQFSKVVRTIKPNVIHSHRYKENILAYLASLGCGPKQALTATQHGLPESYDRANGARHRLLQAFNHWILSRKFRMVTAVSRDVKRSLAEGHGLPEARLSVIHNGVDIPEQPLMRQHQKELRIGSAGRFFPVKDYPFLVEIAKEVVAENSGISFTVSGDGPQFELVESRIMQYGLTGNVHLSGFSSDMENFYQEIDIYINTSQHEGIPMSVLEAMAHGLPVIAPRVGGFEEIISEGVDGFLIKERTAEAFAQKCILLAQNPVLRAQMSVAARRKVVEFFSAERMAREYHDLYLGLAST